MHFGIQTCDHGGAIMKNPTPAILTALASAWERLSAWFGRSQAEQAKQQQTDIDAMDEEIQAMKGDKP